MHRKAVFTHRHFLSCPTLRVVSKYGAFIETGLFNWSILCLFSPLRSSAGLVEEVRGDAETSCRSHTNEDPAKNIGSYRASFLHAFAGDAKHRRDLGSAAKSIFEGLKSVLRPSIYPS